VDGNSLTVWTGTQRPFGVPRRVGRRFHLAADKVHVIHPTWQRLPGGKHTGEMAVEGRAPGPRGRASPSSSSDREEEFTWAYFRPAGVIEIRAAAQSDGKLTAWEVTTTTPAQPASTRLTLSRKARPLSPRAIAAAAGSYRSIGAAANFFARESIGLDGSRAASILSSPLKIQPMPVFAPSFRPRRRHSAGAAKVHARARFGIAGGTEKGGYTAACVELPSRPRLILSASSVLFKPGSRRHRQPGRPPQPDCRAIVRASARAL